MIFFERLKYLIRVEHMIILFKTAKIIVIILLLFLIATTLITASRLTGTIPAAIKKRLDELKLKVLDDGYTLRDLAFHRFFRPDYLGELKNINTRINDRIITECLIKRKKMLIYLVLAYTAAAAVVILYFYSVANFK